MAIHIEPEKGVKMRPAPKIKDLAVKANAAAETARFLHEKGLEIEANAEDKDVAAALAVSYAENPEKTSKGIKGFLVATGYAIPNHIAGLGNAIVQDILFHAEISPKRKNMDILPDEREKLFKAINAIIAEAIKLGGRYDEVDHFGNKGGYIRLMDNKTADTPCTRCGTNIKKISYLGGACYICPLCQK